MLEDDDRRNAMHARIQRESESLFKDSPSLSPSRQEQLKALAARRVYHDFVCAMDDPDSHCKCQYAERLEAAEDIAQEAHALGVSSERERTERLEAALKAYKRHCGWCKGKGLVWQNYDDYGISDPKQIPCSLCSDADAALEAPPSAGLCQSRHPRIVHSTAKSHNQRVE